MRRALGLVVDNWPLKLAAIVLATLLYAGLVLSGNAQVWRGRIPVVPLRQPATAVLLGSIPDVTSVRFLAPVDVAARLSTASFTASIDLADATVSATAPWVSIPVEVTASDPRVQVIDFEPRVVRIQLDPLVTRDVPVQVERGTVPVGLVVEETSVSPSSVAISGPESVVRFVSAAEARVLIQPSGIDVDQTVELRAVDVSGNVLTPVDVEPSSARVRIRVGSQLQTKTLPIRPVVAGSPAAGFEVGSVATTPAVVLVEGEADALAGLVRIDTEAVSVAGARSDLEASVELVLPGGVTAVGGSGARVTVGIRPSSGTRTLRIGIVISGARSDRTYLLSTGDASVTLGGPVELLDALDPSTFVATVDVARLADGSATLPLRVAAPEGLTLLSVLPASVGVTVARPGSVPAPTPSGAS